MSPDKEYKAWAIVQNDGRGFDLETGSVNLPRIFLTISMANNYKDQIRESKKWRDGMIPKLNVVPVKLTIDM